MNRRPFQRLPFKGYRASPAARRANALEYRAELDHADQLTALRLARRQILAAAPPTR